MQLKFCRQTTLTAAPGSIPGKNHGLRLILDAEVNIFCAASKVAFGASFFGIIYKHEQVLCQHCCQVFDTGPGKDVSEGFTIAPSFWNDFPIMDHAGIGIKVVVVVMVTNVEIQRSLPKLV